MSKGSDVARKRSTHRVVMGTEPFLSTTLCSLGSPLKP